MSLIDYLAVVFMVIVAFLLLVVVVPISLPIIGIHELYMRKNKYYVVGYKTGGTYRAFSEEYKMKKGLDGYEKPKRKT